MDEATTIGIEKETSDILWRIKREGAYSNMDQVIKMLLEKSGMNK